MEILPSAVTISLCHWGHNPLPAPINTPLVAWEAAAFGHQAAGEVRHGTRKKLPKIPQELRQPVNDESLSLSSHLSLTGSSSSSSSQFSLCITPPLFHS